MYNVAAIPLAAFGVLGTHGPLIAAVAMGLSDITVIGNAIRLKHKLRNRRIKAIATQPTSLKFTRQKTKVIP